MSTDCYAMVRASALRLTALTPSGSITSPVRTVSTRSVSTIVIDEYNDENGAEVLRSDTDEPRVLLNSDTETLGFIASITFLRTDPSVVELLTGHPVVLSRDGSIVGFDAQTKLESVSFALEVWSSLANRADYGYTIFPFLSGAMLGGFGFGNGLVSFTAKNAKTRRYPKWSVGPYDFSGYQERLLNPVSGNTTWRNMVSALPPPAQTDGVSTFVDSVSNGDPANPDPLRTGILLGGSPDVTSPWITNGGTP